MSLATALGLDKIGQQSVAEAHASINDALVKAEPILVRLANLLGGIAHGLLDRVKLKGTIEFEILPIPKAELANPTDLKS